MHHKVHWRDVGMCQDNSTAYFIDKREPLYHEIPKKHFTNNDDINANIRKAKWVEIRAHKNNEVAAQC